ncbi:hypothetical protein ANCCAN_20862 [Ancylostoma caninum]|uniref:Uncharacterized protein n=1 Tax=Ancylostoma caninum TaxID=29170 RepID=A0A368FM47_ANCCA|nr:hypothetical protein ANCCAN_20862 [Ancylostoma caninum]
MLESEASKSSREERQKILENQIRESSNLAELSSDIKDVLGKYSETFVRLMDTKLHDLLGTEVFLYRRYHDLHRSSGTTH